MVGLSENSKQELYALIEKYDLVEYSELIEKHAEGHISMTTAGEDKYETVGNSRIGGVPDLPPTISWQRTDAGYMSFVAQINLSEILKLPLSPLPKSGLLYFFYGNYPMGLADEQHSVLYYDGDFSQLKKAEQPPMEEFSSESNWAVYKPCQVTMKDSFSLPDGRYSAREVFGQEMDINSEKFTLIADNWYPLVEDLTESQDQEFPEWKMSKILGKPHFLHEGLMSKAQLVREGKPSNSLYKNISDKSEVEKWVILLELSSHQEADMLWWDVGLLDFVIHSDDLSKLDFTKTYSDIASS